MRYLLALVFFAAPLSGCFSTSTATAPAAAAVDLDGVRANELLARPPGDLTDEERDFLLAYLRDSDRELSRQVREARTAAVAAGAAAAAIAIVLGGLTIFSLVQTDP